MQVDESDNWTLPLRGPAGEPVDLGATLEASWMGLPPLRRDLVARSLEVPVAMPRGRPRRLRIEPDGVEQLRLSLVGPRPSGMNAAAVRAAARRVLALDVDLSGFYARAAADAALAWVTSGAGRIGRSPTAFADVVKTLCTVNCSWTATHRMVDALVRHLGERTADGAARAFPTPEAMATAGTRFYRDHVRAGYRAPWLAGVARRVADGEIDLEALADSERSDEEVAARLQALPGVGPYATAHILQLLGRFPRPVLDSWTRPTYARLTGQATVADAEVTERFAGYGPWAGLAFWLFCHRDAGFR